MKTSWTKVNSSRFLELTEGVNSKGSIGDKDSDQWGVRLAVANGKLVIAAWTLDGVVFREIDPIEMMEWLVGQIEATAS